MGKLSAGLKEVVKIGEWTLDTTKQSTKKGSGTGMIEPQKPAKKLTRRYLYDEDYQKVVAFCKERGVLKTWNKANFPYFFNQYLKHLGGGGGE